MRRGLRAALLSVVVCAAPVVARQPQIAITFDDLSSHSVFPAGETRRAIADRVIAALKAAHAGKVYGFVNGVALEREPGTDIVLADWRAAGLPLASHGWSHRNLDTIDLATFETEVMRNEPVLKRHARNSDWHWFRYPFLAEGTDTTRRQAARGILAARGYRIAAVTMGFGDYAGNEPYARCVASRNTKAITGLERSYLAAARSEALRSRAMAKAYGRDIPYVLLMHIGALDARMLPRLLALYREMGFAFTTLPAAERDPAYRDAIDPIRAPGASGLDGRFVARQLPVPPSTVDLGVLDGICR